MEIRTLLAVVYRQRQENALASAVWGQTLATAAQLIADEIPALLRYLPTVNDPAVVEDNAYAIGHDRALDELERWIADRRLAGTAGPVAVLARIAELRRD